MNTSFLHSAEQRLFHATNLTDFVAYWKAQGLLSRKRLEDQGQGFTRFFSDEKDKKLGVWDRAFGNLNDFGKYFWSYESATPNGYGPITLVFSRDVWAGLPDLKITKRTITSDEPEPIPCEEWPSICETVDGVARFKSGYTGCEVSTSTDLIPFSSLAYILVDPIRLGDVSLRDLIKSMIKVDENTFSLTEGRLIERAVYCEPQRDRITRLIEWSRSLRGSLLEDNRPVHESLPTELSEWFDGLEEWKQRIMASWLTYTYNGTLRLMEEANNAMRATNAVSDV